MLKYITNKIDGNRLLDFVFKKNENLILYFDDNVTLVGNCFWSIFEKNTSVVVSYDNENNKNLIFYLQKLKNLQAVKTILDPENGEDVIEFENDLSLHLSRANRDESWSLYFNPSVIKLGKEFFK